MGKESAVPYFNVLVAGHKPVFTIATVEAPTVAAAVKAVMTQAREEHPEAGELAVEEVYRLPAPDAPFYDGVKVR